MDSITITRPDDFHIHFRKNELMERVVPFTAKSWGKVIVMPNLSPPITTGKQAHQYALAIRRSAHDKNPEFKAYPLIKLIRETTPQIIKEAQRSGVIAAKLYPEGVTTNSEDGIKDIHSLYPLFDAMQEVGMVLSIHGEKPGVFVLDREMEFLCTLEQISIDFPNLKIVLEHITTRDAVDLIVRLPERVVATVTIHHLLITLDDVLCDKRGGNEFLNPHNYCKPVAKYHRDRTALQKAVLSGSPKFFFGSDSAPHHKNKKESDCGCAGVWTAPVALPLLVDFFEREQSIERLSPFVSEFGAQFYGLPLNKGTVTLGRKKWMVPRFIRNHLIQNANSTDVVPFMAGKELDWQVVEN